MKIFNLIPTMVFILFFSSITSAIQIMQTKGDKVLLNLEGEVVTINQKVFLLNAANKKIALATITQFKNDRAIAQINKGKPEGATSVQIVKSTSTAMPTPSPTNSTNGSETQAGTNEPYRLRGLKISGLFNLAMNNMTVKQSDGTLPVPNQEDVMMNGMSFGASGAIDYPLMTWLTLRGTLGYEPFTATGTSRYLSCDSLTSTNCNATMQYLAAGGYARYDFTDSKFLIWAGLGGTIKFPIGKSSTALRTDDIKMTFTMALAGGMDYYISNKNFIPVSLEYQLFQSSSTVSASIMLIRAGYGWAF